MRGQFIHRLVVVKGGGVYCECINWQIVISELLSAYKLGIHACVCMCMRMYVRMLVYMCVCKLSILGRGYVNLCHGDDIAELVKLDISMSWGSARL